MFQSVDELTKMLQASIGPVAIISGVGLLLLNMTNRYARISDRIRSLIREMSSRVSATEKNILMEEIRILHRRALLLRSSITFASISVFLVAITIFSFFIIQLFELPWHILTALSFFLSLLSLIVSVAYFIKDVSMSLDALSVEIKKCNHEST